MSHRHNRTGPPLLRDAALPSCSAAGTITPAGEHVRGCWDGVTTLAHHRSTVKKPRSTDCHMGSFQKQQTWVVTLRSTQRQLFRPEENVQVATPGNSCFRDNSRQAFDPNPRSAGVEHAKLLRSCDQSEQWELHWGPLPLNRRCDICPSRHPRPPPWSYLLGPEPGLPARHVGKASSLPPPQAPFSQYSSGRPLSQATPHLGADP